MVKSMTGFGSSELVLGAFHHRLEVRAVNSKYCDIKVKTPPDLSIYEIRIHELVRQRLTRGRIEVVINRDAAEPDVARSVRVNWALAEQYHRAYTSMREKFSVPQDINLSMLVNARDVITLAREDEDSEAVWKRLEKGLEGTLASVIRMREAEGRTLAMDMAGRCNALRERLSQVQKIAPTVVEGYRKRLVEKIAAISPQEIDESRLAQEIVYYADRCDVAEELTRLKSHIQQLLSYLEADEPVGRKLDFLVQEMNREANTIGSKSNSAPISLHVVEIKSELERLREQIQNVE